MGGNISSKGTKVLIIGSIGMDQTIFKDDIPKYGEIKKAKIVKNPGGKGNNEAIACARAGGETTFIGVVGDDYQTVLERTLIENNISPILTKLKTIDSHTASIIVGNNGESKIIVNPGADEYLDKNIINNNLNFVEKASIIMLQLEIPIETVEYVIDISHRIGKTIILNPSPPIQLPDKTAQEWHHTHSC